MKPQALARHWRPTWELVLVAVVTVLTSINLLVAHAPFFRTAALFSDTKAVGGNAFITDTLDPPTGLSTTGGSCISLEWTATADTYASGHRVLRGTTTGGPYTQISEVTPRATTTYADSPADGTYYYVLRSFFQNWESGNSGEATATAGWSATERVSVDTAGAQGNNKSDLPAISDDGRHVVFASDASDLVAGDTNAVKDVFVHDRQTAATTRVSVDSAGAQGNDKSDRPAISGDGCYAVFASDASDLVAGDPGGVLTGTLVPSATEAEIVAGSDTLVITLSTDTWDPTVGADNAITTALINGIDSAQAEATGWDAVVKAGLTFNEVTRTSDTVVTITLPAFATYDITADETITVTVPATAVTSGSAIVATPTFDVVFAASTAKWTFEDVTTEGWTDGGPAATGVANSTAVAYEGTHSLSLGLSNATNSDAGRVEHTAPGDLTTGNVIKAQVYAPSSGLQAILFIQDKNWIWYQAASYTSLPAATWTELQFTVPGGADTPLQRLGVQFIAVSGSWTGTVYIDAVDY